MAISHSPLPEQAWDFDFELQKCFSATFLGFEGVTLSLQPGFEPTASSDTAAAAQSLPPGKPPLVALRSLALKPAFQ